LFLRQHLSNRIHPQSNVLAIQLSILQHYVEKQYFLFDLFLKNIKILKLQNINYFIFFSFYLFSTFRLTSNSQTRRLSCARRQTAQRTRQLNASRRAQRRQSTRRQHNNEHKLIALIIASNLRHENCVVFLFIKK
jgi:hypothetical protein